MTALDLPFNALGETQRYLLIAVRDAIAATHRALGAPGDYGYGTPQGDALFELYKQRAAVADALEADEARPDLAQLREIQQTALHSALDPQVARLIFVLGKFALPPLLLEEMSGAIEATIAHLAEGSFYRDTLVHLTGLISEEQALDLLLQAAAVPGIGSLIRCLGEVPDGDL